MEFWVPLRPPSENRIYQFIWHQKRMFLSAEAKKFKFDLGMCCPPDLIQSDQLYHITYTVHANWLYKNGKVKKADIHNLNKIILDALAERYATDDSFFWRVDSGKLHEPDPKKHGIEIKIKQLKQ